MFTFTAQPAVAAPAKVRRRVPRVCPTKRKLAQVYFRAPQTPPAKCLIVEEEGEE